MFVSLSHNQIAIYYDWDLLELQNWRSPEDGERRPFAIISHHKISTKKKEEMKGIKTGKISLNREKTNIPNANLG